MCLSCWGYTFVVPRWKARRRLGSRSFQDYLLVSVTRPTVFLIRVLFEQLANSNRPFPFPPIPPTNPPGAHRRAQSRSDSEREKIRYHFKGQLPLVTARKCDSLRVSANAVYFITQAVDILYGTLCARGLAYYGTEGQRKPCQRTDEIDNRVRTWLQHAPGVKIRNFDTLNWNAPSCRVTSSRKRYVFGNGKSSVG